MLCVRAGRRVLLMSLLQVALGATAWEDPEADAALEVDGQCSTAGANGSECALNALQFRGRKELAMADTAASDEDRGEGSCKSYGCVSYVQGHACQCNDRCQQYGDCCLDYQAQCSPPHGQESCASYGCVGYVPGHACQCNDKCQLYGDCCLDHEALCAAPAPPPAPAAPTAASPPAGTQGQGNCKSYGCVGYIHGHACQCNDKCQHYGDCCSDYEALCVSSAASPPSPPEAPAATGSPSEPATAPATPSPPVAPSATPPAEPQGQGNCKSYGCVGYIHGHACQCNDKCQHYGDCCSDYEALCVSSAASTASSQEAPATTTMTAPSEPASTTATPSAPAAPTATPSGSQLPTPQSSPAAPPAESNSFGGKIFGHPSASAEYPSYPGFSLMLVEEFDSPIDLDSDPIWTWSDGGLAEGEARFVKENIKFEEGKMVIELSSTPPTHAQPCSHAEVDIIPDNKTATSGEIRTKHNMFRYGRYEVRMKAPTVQPSDPIIDGNFIATMFVFRDAKFKHWREIDIEILGDSSGRVSTNVITGENVQKFRIDMDRSKKYEAPFNVRADFHTYAFEWLPDRVTWFVDGKVIREEKLGDVPIPELPGKIIMNLWEFDKRALFGGKEIWNDRLPMRSEYEWFRFYKWDGETQYPCAGMAAHCLTEDDLYLSGNNPCDGIPQVGTVFGEAPCTATCLTR